MDSQKNDASSPTPTDDEVNANATNEANVPANPIAVGSPAVDSTVSADPSVTGQADSTGNPDDNAVSFITNSDGTVQSAPAPTSADGISTPPLGSEGAPTPDDQQPGAAVQPQGGQDSFGAPSTDVPPAPSFDAQSPISGVQPGPVDPSDPSTIPNTAPVPVPAKDKKTLLVLVVVAVVLLVGIAALLLL